MTVPAAAHSTFPTLRLRRLRRHPLLRELVRETELSVRDLILPLFIRTGTGSRQPIASLPGHAQLTVDLLAEEVKEVVDLGIPAVILFGIPASKDATGTLASLDNGVVQQAVHAIKKATSDLLVVTDLCLCEYTDHGHCGVVTNRGAAHADVDNDATLDLLAQQAVSHARAGADVIAPSGMMDGMVGAIRKGLDTAGYEETPVLSYAAKYASAFYGPFREAAESAPQFGDRKGYQMDPANAREALREVALDLAEGADLIMVKPALSYLDVICRVKQAHPEVPLCAFNVSGEYAMLKAAGANGWLDEQRTTLEVLTSIKRAGADMIMTYSAKDIARWSASVQR
ncbi:MAG: porphobilinogen synthase [Planctomycetaceae bacterium]